MCPLGWTYSKSLLLVGALGMCVSILTAGLLIHYFNVDEEREGGEESEEERQVVGYFVALLIVLFVSFFAATLGIVFSFLYLVWKY